MRWTEFFPPFASCPHDADALGASASRGALFVAPVVVQWRLVCILFAILRLVAPEFFSICDWNRVFSLLRMVSPSPILWEGEGVGAQTSHAAPRSTLDALLRRPDGLPSGAIPGPRTS